MEIKVKNIQELLEAVKTGKVDESKLIITLDNDNTSFSIGPWDEEAEEWAGCIKVESANGYFDIEELYSLLFPKATVEWC